MLSAGATLGPYEVVAPLGAGGMGEVYRARDTRLDRTVAIKVLPSHIAADPEARQRFEREARAVSSLNHPHICTLHDIGHEDGVDYLVMEHIEGETLVDRLKKGPLPLDRTLKHAVEIADALDKAHRQGVVHRDLKPGNIMLTRSGTKLLDFGLARLGSSAGPSDLSSVPTRSAGLTGNGQILGTLPYMAPEQLEGKEADARTDIFAFGATLYEMLTGRKPFEGGSQAGLVSAIMTSKPPPLTSLQPTYPALLERIVEGCLAKDRDDRWWTAGDVAKQLKWVTEGPSRPGGRVWRSTTRWAAALALACAVTGVVSGLVAWSVRGSRVEKQAVRFTLDLPPDFELTGGHGVERLGFALRRPSRVAVAFSPDGAHLVFGALNREEGVFGGRPWLFLRRLDQLEAAPIPGTEGATSPFFSPDGSWIGFWVPKSLDLIENTPRGELRKIQLEGGSPVPLCDTTIPYGASWGSDDSIVFARQEGGIWRVPAGGGRPEEITRLDTDRKESAHRLPQLLPGGALLFTILKDGSLDQAQIVVQSLESGDRTVLAEGGTDGRLGPSGHLLFVRDGTLMAAPFDLESLELTDEPRPVAEGVMHAMGGDLPELTTGAAQFTFSASGALAYVPGDTYPGLEIEAVWVSRQGALDPFTAITMATHPRFSPDGDRLAFERRTEGDDSDIWVHDMKRGTSQRLTFDGANHTPAWSPDGDRIIFASDHEGPVSNLYVVPAAGGTLQRVTEGTEHQLGPSWSTLGAVAFVQNDDIWVLDVDGDRVSRPFLKTRFKETHPEFSPDGFWLAYVSDESGRAEVYVRPYPGPGPARLVSTNGGYSPAWARSGRELFFRVGGDAKMMRVGVTATPTLDTERPTPLFSDPDNAGSSSAPTRAYDVAPDSGRFLMIRAVPLNPTPATGVVVVLNWFEELERLVPRD